MADDDFDPIEHARRRPGMYFANTGASGMRFLLMEVVANAVDQALAGSADAIAVSIHSDGSASVRDNGPGVGAASPDGVAHFVTEMLTSSRDTPTADEHRPHVHLSFGTGLGPVCAVCSRIEVSVVTDNKVFDLSFARGHLLAAAERHRGDEAGGTRMRMWPDPQIFTDGRWDLGLVQSELVPLAQLIPGLEVRFDVEHQTYGPFGDLGEMFWDACGRHKELIGGEPLLLSHESGSDRVRLALGWRAQDLTPTVRSYCNLRATSEEGSEVQGIDEGLRMVFGDGPTVALCRGMVAVLDVLLLEPQFGGPTRARLDMPAAVWLVADTIAQGLPGLLAAHPDLESTLRARHTARGDRS